MSSEVIRRARVSRPRRDTIALTIPKNAIWIGVAIASAIGLVLFSIGVWVGGRTVELPAPVATRVVLTKPTDDPPPPPVEEAQAEAPEPDPEPPPPAKKVKLDVRERAPSGRFGIQVGAFSSRQEASAFLQMHASTFEGLPIYALPAKVGSKGVWHRVRVGNFADDEAAQKVLRTLPPDVAKGSLVVRYP